MTLHGSKKTGESRNSMFSKKQKVETSKIRFSIKLQLGYLETHLFTTLGRGVTHGIQISIKITKIQIPTLFCFWWITTLHSLWKTGESRISMFKKKQKVETSKIRFSITFQLGYLETHLFTSLGEGVKHGIKILTEMTKFQISNSLFVLHSLQHYEIC